MNRSSLLSLLLACGSPLAAVEHAADSFGDQPVAIGAGARALGMGGAFSAIADDATACTWNPAGLTQCERPELAASFGWWRTSVTIDETETDQSLRPEHISVLQPFFAGGCMQVVGLAWQRQYDFTRSLSWQHSDYVDSFPIELTTVDTREFDREGAFSSLGLSYAIEPRPGLSLGLSLNAWGDAWTGASAYDEHSSWRSTTTFSFFGTPDPPSISDDDVDSTTTVQRGVSAVIGLCWQALPSLTVALVLKPGYGLELETSTQRQRHTDDGAGLITDEHYSSVSEATLHHPSSATLGLAWRHADLDTVSFDATWTDWSGYYRDDASGRHSPVNVLIPPEDFSDLWTLRLGYEHVAILDRLILVPRCGALVEWLPAASTIPDINAGSQVEATADRWLGLTAGLSLVQRWAVWDGAVQVKRGNDVGAWQYAPPDRTADVTLITVRVGVTIPF